MSTSLVVVYHPKCKPSTDFIIKTKELKNVEIEFVNIQVDKIESQIDIDIVPLIILNNDENQIYKGRRAFEKIEAMIREPIKNKQDKTLKYGGGHAVFKPDDGKKTAITLEMPA